MSAHPSTDRDTDLPSIQIKRKIFCFLRKSVALPIFSNFTGDRSVSHQQNLEARKSSLIQCHFTYRYFLNVFERMHLAILQ